MSTHELKKANSVCYNGTFSPVFSDAGDRRDCFSVAEDPDGEAAEDHSQANVSMEIENSNSGEEDKPTSQLE